MGLRSSIKFAFNQIRPKEWAGVSFIRENANFIGHIFDQIAGPAPTSSAQSFDQWAVEQQLTQDQLAACKKKCFQLMCFYWVALACALVYAAYLFMGGKLAAFLIVMPLMLMLFSFGWRECVIYLKIEHRRLTMSSNWECLKLLLQKGE